MAEKKGVGHAYNIDFLNVVFAASSMFLFLSVIWMVWDDFDRDWKNTQRQFAQLEYRGDAGAARSRRRAASTRASCSSSRRSSRPRRRAMAANQQKIDELQRPAGGGRQRGCTAPTQDYQFAKATYDQRPLRLRGGARRQDVRARRARAEGDRRAEAQRLNELNLERREDDGRAGGAAGRARQVHRRGRPRCRSRSTSCNAEQTRLQQAARRHRAERRQGLLPQRAAARLHGADAQGAADHPAERRRRRELHRACRRWIGARPATWRSIETGYEKYPQPFTTHPNLATYLGSDSPHPIDQVGCTVCHEGMGQSVSFRDAAHTPANEKQKQEWEEKYHWEEPHLWDYPMLPTKHDRSVVREVPQAGGLRPERREAERRLRDLRARRLLRLPQDQGFENLRKPGPILTKIDSKLTRTG